MTTTVTTTDNLTFTVTMDGRLDTAASQQCLEDLKTVLETPGANITVDCTDLEYISSSGLRIFLTLYKSAFATKGSLRVTNLNPDVRNIFNITGFSKRFGIE